MCVYVSECVDQDRGIDRGSTQKNKATKKKKKQNKTNRCSHQERKKKKKNCKNILTLNLIIFCIK